MVLFVLHNLILQTRMRNHPVGLDVCCFGRTLRLLPYFMCSNSEGSGETVRMRRLAGAFAGRLCDKDQLLMSWLKYDKFCCLSPQNHKKSKNIKTNAVEGSVEKKTTGNWIKHLENNTKRNKILTSLGKESFIIKEPDTTWLLRQIVFLVFNPITVNNIAALLNFTPVGRASDLMKAPA